MAWRTGPSFTRWRRALLAGAAVGLVLSAVLYLVAVRTELGQRVDEAMKAWWLPWRMEWQREAELLAKGLVVAALALALVASAVLALVARRWRAAVVIAAIGLGSPALTTIGRDFALSRPFTVDGAFPYENTMPSVHASAIVAGALVLVLLMPRRSGACVVAAVGAATGSALMVVAALHRPSDVAVASVLAGAWAAVVVALVGAPGGAGVARRRTWPAVGAVLAGLLAVVAALLVLPPALEQPDVVPETSWRFFLGALAFVVGAAIAAVMAFVALDPGLPAEHPDPDQEELDRERLSTSPG
jgi:membrane-associated phospholipid phosphatase